VHNFRVGNAQGGTLKTIGELTLMKKLVLLGLVASLGLGGCATITRTEHDAWTVKTTPGAAAVKTSNGFACDATPCTFRIERKAEFDVTITKPGYKTWSGHVTHKVSGAGGAGMAGNVLVGGLIGVAVDANSGAMFDLVPNPLEVTLEKNDVPAASGGNMAVDGVVYTPAAAPTPPPASAPPAATPAPAPVAAPLTTAPTPATPSAAAVPASTPTKQ